MGWGAAYAYAEEMGFSPEESYEILYGSDLGQKPKFRCPICNKKCGGRQGVIAHAVDAHTKPKHQERIQQFIVDTCT